MSLLSPERKRSLEAKARQYAASLSDERALSYLLSRGISKEAAEMFGLGWTGDDEFVPNCISIPYQGRAGVRDIKYRAIDPDADPKYKKEPGCGSNLYNAQVLRTAQQVALCEGELDAIAIQAYCGVPAVAFPGTDTWNRRGTLEAPDKDTTHWPLSFEGIPRVWVIADGDAVGRNAAQKVADSIGWSAKVIDLGNKQDANSFIAQFGAAAFKERLK